VALLIGNERYLGIYDGVYLAMNEADYKSGSIVKDIKDNIYNTYVAVDRLGDSVINIYSSDLSAVDDSGSPVEFGPDDTIKLGGYIGAMFVRNGIIYVTNQDETDDAFTVSYVNGARISPLQYVSGDLPKFNNTTWYKGFLTFFSDGYIYQTGQVDTSEGFVLTKLASNSNIHTIATPFSTLIIADNTSIYKNSGYSNTSKSTSLVFTPSNDINLGIIKNIVVRTNALETGAGCKIKIVKNGESESAARYITISSVGEIMHTFRNIDIVDIKNFKIIIDWSTGSTTKPCHIREIYLTGQTKEV